MANSGIENWANVAKNLYNQWSVILKQLPCVDGHKMTEKMISLGFEKMGLIRLEDLNLDRHMITRYDREECSELYINEIYTYVFII